MVTLSDSQDPWASATAWESGTAGERSRDQRRSALMRDRSLTGLDYVRVRRREETGEALVWTLDLHFVPAPPGSNKVPVPPGLAAGDLAFTLDGQVDPRLEVQALEPGGEPNVLTARLRTPLDVAPDPHDAAVYRLEVRGAPGARGDRVMEVLDPLFDSAPVRLDADAATTWSLPSLTREAPVPVTVPTDYLAKDYDSFRRLLMERMSFYMPSWVERNPSDLGVALLEVLAYAADYLSYQQDAVATEAYLETARRRVSVRRHARLLDFRLLEGSNARAWVQIQVAEPSGRDEPGSPGAVAHAAARLPAGTELLTTAERQPSVLAPGSEGYRRALEGGSLVFQTLHPVELHPGHQRLEIHTWGADDYTLPRGSTAAALVGTWKHLAAGDVLVLEKRQGRRREGSVGRGDRGGSATVIADPRERHAVRLAAEPRFRRDPLTGTDLTEIRWHIEDGLPLDFPVARVEGAVRHRSLTLMRGNLVLCDHGRSVEELLPPVPSSGRYAPRLARTGLTFRIPVEPQRIASNPAGWILDPGSFDPDHGAQESRPDIVLEELPAGFAAEAEDLRRRGVALWRPRFDLLGSSRFDRHFVVEVDEEGWPHLRFGDGSNGRRPRPGARFRARFRVGGGPKGNVGSHSIRHLVVTPEVRLRLAAAGVEVTGAVNQLPAAGGRHPTAVDYARVYAPDRLHADEFQERCATDGDSACLAKAHPEVQDAAARHVWTGSARTVELYVLPTLSGGDREGRLTADFKERLYDHLAPRLLVGWQLDVRPPRWVPLDVEVTVWLERGERAARLYERLAAGGGHFAAAEFGFGQPVYASRITSRLLAVPGVADVRIDELHRWGQPSAGELENGVVPIGPLEVARLDNDPEAPQRGTLRVTFAAADPEGAS